MTTTIGELNRRIEILELHEERDSFGAIVGNWITVGRVWAKIVPGVGRENLINEQVQGIQEATITVRFYPAMSLKHRVKYLDRYYDIIAVKDKITAHRWTEIQVREIIDGIQCETEKS